MNISSLPVFPWDLLTPVRAAAQNYSDGSIDLTIGTPVDPVPDFLRHSLEASFDSHSYPQTIGTADLRTKIALWLATHRGVSGKPAAIPTIGSKEMVALLPSFLGLGEGDIVAFPRQAYPTYDVGARLAGATPLPINTDADPHTWPEDISLVWINSPGNPNGHVLNVTQLRAIRKWARANNVIVASDECYAPLVWDVDEAPSLLDSRVTGDDYSGLLMLYSLSKQSNLAGYRTAFIAGDQSLIARMSELRKHAGFMMPSISQAIMSAALDDDTHVREQKERYAKRRLLLLEACTHIGLVNDPQNAGGLYLWVRANEDLAAALHHFRRTLDFAQSLPNNPAWDLVCVLAAHTGIVCTPGDFYGSAGASYVRMSLTARDTDIEKACERMSDFSSTHM